jgi:hypothetical protein
MYILTIVKYSTRDQEYNHSSQRNTFRKSGNTNSDYQSSKYANNRRGNGNYGVENFQLKIEKYSKV